MPETASVTSPADSSPPASSMSRWGMALIGGGTGVAIVAVITGFLLVGWVEENQAAILERFAVESEEASELSRQPNEIASDYRALAARVATKPLPFLWFGIVVIEHRDCFGSNARTDADSLGHLESLIANLTEGEFNPVAFAQQRGTEQ